MKRRANDGSFKKGNVPYNKGTNISSRKHHTRKGVQGFLKRSVLMIAQDGSVACEFESVAECQKYLGLKDRHSISYAIKKQQLCAGHKLLYEDDWSPLGDYRWRPTIGRNIDGSLKKGHPWSSLYNSRMSEEMKEKRRKASSEQSKRMADDPNSKWGKGVQKPILCITTGIRYESIKQASSQLNIPANYISAAILRFGTTKGLKFRNI